MPRLIAHQIKKEQHSTAAEIVFREGLIPTTEQALALISSLREAIRKHNPQGARFKRPAGEEAPLQGRILRYRNQNSDESFVEMTCDATRKLRTEMERHSASVGGYLVFAEFDHSEENYLAIVLLTSKASAQFDDAMNLSEVTTLDVEHVRHAARFRYSGVAGNDPGTVYFVARASEGKFFREFIDCDPVSDSRIQSSRLRTTINLWVDGRQLNEDQKEEIYKKTYSYWSSCRKENLPMTLEGLSNSVYPNDPEPFRAFLSQENNLLGGEFTPPNPSDMKQFKKFAFNGRGLRLEFDRSGWLENITSRNGNLTIRRAPQELLDMLAQEE